MLVQFQWQSHADPSSREFVSQCSPESQAEFEAVWDRVSREHRPPDGFGWLVCTEDSPLFFVAARMRNEMDDAGKKIAAKLNEIEAENSGTEVRASDG